MSEITDFAKKVYKSCKKIPKGRVSTYKQIAISIGNPNAVRAVGHALSINPFSPKVPCHRVVKSSGELGGFKGDIEGKNIKKKIKLLKSEGIKISDSGKTIKIKNFSKKLYCYTSQD